MGREGRELLVLRQLAGVEGEGRQEHVATTITKFQTLGYMPRAHLARNRERDQRRRLQAPQRQGRP